MNLVSVNSNMDKSHGKVKNTENQHLFPIFGLSYDPRREGRYKLFQKKTLGQKKTRIINTGFSFFVYFLRFFRIF